MHIEQMNEKKEYPEEVEQRLQRSALRDEVENINVILTSA